MLVDSPRESAPGSGRGRVPAWREVDLEAIAHNVGLLARRCAPADLMVVVKADGYSHGAAQVARVALAAGASRLGVAVLEEALELRRAGIEAPVLAWLAAPGAPYDEAIAAGVELGVQSTDQLAEILRAARATGAVAQVHLEVETGMWRGGAAQEWSALVAQARDAEVEGTLQVVGIWSHLACADTPDDPATDAQRRAFLGSVAQARTAGLRPRFRHLANSAATLTRPDLHFDLVRCGLAVYGVDPLAAPGSAPGSAPDLRPALTVRARVAQVKRAPAGVGVSYGHTYRTTAPTTLAVVPLGYADGVPVGPGAWVGWRGQSVQVAGRVCMDQLVLDVGELPVQPGDEVTLLGAGHDGEPTAGEWARLSGRSAYEMVTGFGRHRVPIIES